MGPEDNQFEEQQAVCQRAAQIVHQIHELIGTVVQYDVSILTNLNED